MGDSNRWPISSARAWIPGLAADQRFDEAPSELMRPSARGAGMPLVCPRVPGSTSGRTGVGSARS
jgi:hypothetical protein